jgi:type IV pilus assembly protein PilB
VVLRILRPDAVRIGLVNLGFEPDNLEIFNKIIRKPNGIFLVTGPTGSGKTTTLYTALDVLNRPTRRSSRPRTRSSTTSRGSTSARCATASA